MSSPVYKIRLTQLSRKRINMTLLNAQCLAIVATEKGSGATLCLVKVDWWIVSSVNGWIII